jgi:hypothetical protein
MSSWFAEWNGTDFNQGNNTNFAACASNPYYDQLSDVATVTDNNDGTYRINWNSCITGGAFNSQVGFWQLDLLCTVGCTDTQLGVADTLTADQGAVTNTRTATIGGGDIVITSGMGVSPANVTFAWTRSDTSIIDTDGNSTDGSFTFDPNAIGLAAGNYVFTATYLDENTTPPTKGSGEFVVRLLASTTGDVADDNDNGIENKDDAGLLATQLQAILGASSSTYIIESSAGSLRLGRTAFCAGTAARISFAELEANASKTCGTTLNTSDNKVKTVGIGGYYDFEVANLSQGETVDVVIPLTAPIPAHAVYRKYTPVVGWSTFLTQGNDKLASAASTSAGVCPSPSSTAYTPGLSAGNDCLRMSITDGGVNDGDDSANGLVKDPGAVAEIKSGTEASLPGGCSISGGPGTLSDHSEWILVAAFVTWLGFAARRRGFVAK